MRSMTGFAQAQQLFEQGNLGVEIRAVNGRFLDLQIKLPREFFIYEEQIKKCVAQHVVRGRVTLNIVFEKARTLASAIEVDVELAQAYHAAIGQLQGALGLTGEVPLHRYPNYQDFFQKSDRGRLKEAPLSYDKVEQVVVQALQEFNKMRAQEGQHMKDDLCHHLHRLKTLITEVGSIAEATKEAYRKRLHKSVTDLLQDAAVDENRLLLEVGVFAERIDIAEELIRFFSHVSKMEELLQEGLVGRKAEFILQELHREVNTLSNKCADYAVSERAVEAKCELEKMREQIQNVE